MEMDKIKSWACNFLSKFILMLCAALVILWANVYVQVYIWRAEACKTASGGYETAGELCQQLHRSLLKGGLTFYILNIATGVTSYHPFDYLNFHQ